MAEAYITLSLRGEGQKRQNQTDVKYREIVANKIINAGFSVGWVSALDDDRRTVWILDAHRGDGKHFAVRGMKS